MGKTLTAPLTVQGLKVNDTKAKSRQGSFLGLNKAEREAFKKEREDFNNAVNKLEEARREKVATLIEGEETGLGWDGPAMVAEEWINVPDCETQQIAYLCRHSQAVGSFLDSYFNQGKLTETVQNQVNSKLGALESKFGTV